MKILGIETSCDETSAAVLDNQIVLSNVISSQQVHLNFGGVVPELATRAHLRKVIPVVEQALAEGGVCLAEIDGFAVTHGPGLVGALLVGLNYAKGVSAVTGKPYIGVNHIEGHVYSNFLEDSPIECPFLCLLVSGGHTQLVVVRDHLEYQALGKTRDDAVGEAFDKVAKLLGLPYPGGPQIDRLAAQGDPEYTEFPLGLHKEKTFDFSYSGLKTAVLTHWQSLGAAEQERHQADVCAAFQKAAVKILVKRTMEAAKKYGLKAVGVAGGVAANSGLRKAMKTAGEKRGIVVHFPKMAFCTDNAAMIARAGLERLKRGETSKATLNAFPSLQLGDARHLL